MSDTPRLEEDFITPDEIRSSLGASGYLLEGRIAQVLQGLTTHVELNSFTADPRDEGRSIEIDVWGRFSEALGDGHDSVVAAETMIECKNNSQPVVFFMKSSANRWASMEHIKCSGFPVSSADPETHLHVRMQDLLEMTFHHYCDASDVATQFCGFTRDQPAEEKQRKQQEKLKVPISPHRCWKTESMEQYSKSFSSLCVAAEFTECQFVALDQQNIQLGFTYPIVVFQGPFYEARTTSTEIDLRRSNHLQFHHSTSVRGQVTRAQIDVVSESHFPILVQRIVEEVRYIAKQITRHHARLLVSAIDQKQLIRQRRVVSALTASRLPGDLY